MKKVIAIVAGGDSSEHDVSLRSAAGINSWIDKEKYDVYIVEVSHEGWFAHLADGCKSPVYRHNFSFKDGWGRDIKPDYAYITIHGTPGEDGILQGYFDLLSIPYSTSSVLVESMTYNKFALNQFLRAFGVKVAEDVLVRQGQTVDAAQKIGDDYLQKNARGYATPESFTHGTSAQRMRWLKKGLSTGDMSQGDTFSPAYNTL